MSRITSDSGHLASKSSSSIRRIFRDSFRIGLDGQPFLDQVNTGGDQPLPAPGGLDFHQAKAAGAVRSHRLVSAQGGDIDVVCTGGFQYRCALFCFNLSSVNR